MNRYIIGYGRRRHEKAGWCYAKNLDDALTRATALSMADGCLDDDLADTTWAEPWDDWRARDLGLLTLDEREQGWQTMEALGA